MKPYYIFIIIALVTFACAEKDKSSKKESLSSEIAPVDGVKVYKQNCELCHGPDGKLAANGSKDLTISDLDLNERILQISKGKGAMVAYENILSLAEIRAVAEYTMTLK